MMASLKVNPAKRLWLIPIIMIIDIHIQKLSVNCYEKNYPSIAFFLAIKPFDLVGFKELPYRNSNA